MLLETLMNQRNDTGDSSSTPQLSTATTMLDVNHDLATKEAHTPLVLRSEAEQLVGQQLIKALSNFKHLLVPPLPPRPSPPQQNSPTGKDTIVVHSEGTRRHNWF